MKTQTSNAVAYCFDLLSSIFMNNELSENIRAVYVFGSAVRSQLEKESDIDLFFDCKKEHEAIVKRAVDSGIRRFFSSKDYEKWTLLHFTFPFSVQVGVLAEWDVKLSIASEGLLLYSKKQFLNEGERSVLFNLQYPKKKKEYIRIRRMLFGRDEKEYHDKGLMQAVQGKKISAHVFIVPKEEQSRIIDVLAKENVNFSMNEIVSLES